MSKKILKIGHRGAKTYVAENTIASVEKALNLAVDAIEIDVHRCASGELVVFHDFTLDRMTNGTGEVAKHTLRQLKKLKVNNQYEIPTLEEVLDAIDKKCLLNIELKGRDTATTTCKIIEDYIKTKHWNVDHFIISSFQHQELEMVYKLNNQLRLGVLTKASVLDAIDFAETINAYAIHPNVALVTKDNVSLAQNKGYKVLTWTVNDQSTIERVKTYQVDGIISDNPDMI
ncbi:glycerophosphodiester phosphodiesterase [Psychroserpens sp.]|uniref:glycerophosphodiester phosphodiesterase n=1 Tax=Psychroserpens sp. TaxID=2020870 RepID=UPI002B27A8AF|nr:glycerophosphodiester phosphodiesterase family protein [Psychroserpens sp.]